MSRPTFWQPIGKPLGKLKEKIIENYVFYKKATYI